MNSLIHLFKGDKNSKLSMARIMLWVLFIFMMACEWRVPDRIMFQWEAIFMGLLAYTIGGKYLFDKYVHGTKKESCQLNTDTTNEDTGQEY